MNERKAVQRSLVDIMMGKKELKGTLPSGEDFLIEEEDKPGNFRLTVKNIGGNKLHTATFTIEDGKLNWFLAGVQYPTGDRGVSTRGMSEEEVQEWYKKIIAMC